MDHVSFKSIASYVNRHNGLPVLTLSMFRPTLEWLGLGFMYARMYPVIRHPPLKSIGVVYEYAFPLLLANKHNSFFSI
jgi:hypothetical protein